MVEKRVAYGMVHRKQRVCREEPKREIDPSRLHS